MEYSKKDLDYAIKLFSKRHDKDLKRVLGRLKILYNNLDFYKIQISATPSKADIEKLTKHLIKIVKFVYMGTILAKEDVIKYCYLNGNCDHFIGAISAVYEKNLGIKIQPSTKFPTKGNNELYILPVGRPFNFKPCEEQKDTIYLIGFGWKEENDEYKTKQPYTYHRALYLNGEYFDICGGKNEKEFKEHLKENYQTNIDTMFKTNANIGYDIFSAFLKDCVVVEKKMVEPQLSLC